MDLIVALTYVLMLGSIGIIMLRESLATLEGLSQRRAPQPPGRSIAAGSRRLPFKMRFRQSRLYISVIPPIVIGFVVGALSAIMGIGGGFIIVPAMIYLLRMPTNVVMGTSLVQIIAVTAVTTVLQATSNYAVDIVLAGLLVSGGVVGAQFGVRAGAKLRGEQLRLLLALLVLAVARGLAVAAGGAPGRCLFPVRGAAMKRDRCWPCFLLLAAARRGPRTWCPASARTSIQITSNYTGTDIVVFGAIEQAAERRRAATSWWWCAVPTSR